MRRMRLRTAMVAVAVLAVILGTGVGLRRRARQLDALFLQYGREANHLENVWRDARPTPPGEPDVLMEQIHWHDSVAYEYRLAAARPWFPFDPEPRRITCGCGYHAARRAATTR